MTRSALHELPTGQTSFSVILVMEAGNDFVRLVGMNMKDIEVRSLKK